MQIPELNLDRLNSQIVSKITSKIDFWRCRF